MGEFSSGAWREQVRSASDKNRAITAAKATRISESAMAEVLSALNEYWDAIDDSDLKERSKGIYMSMADNFVRWMRDEFVPGSRSTLYGYPPRRFKSSPRHPSSAGEVVCRCGHSPEDHIFPNSAQYADCHLCQCELYNPPGGIKGLPIHPLYAFTEDEFRMVSCARCGQFRVVPDGVCETCAWDNDNAGPVEQTRPEYCQHSPTKRHEAPSLASNRCRFCMHAVRVAPGAHGTHERWEEGCDCNDCRSGMRQWIADSGIPASLAATLRDLLMFRRNVNELWLTERTLKNDAKRQSIDSLVNFGVLSKASDAPASPGRFRLRLDRLQNSR